VIVDSAAPTGLYLKEISAVGETTVYYYRRGSAASRMRPDDLDAEYLTGARWLHVTGITPALSESCRDTVEHAIELARAAGLEVSFDPNMRLKLWTVEQARETMFPLIRRSTILLGGMEELSLLLEVRTPDAAADWALEQGLSIAVIKLGADGALVATPSERRAIPPYTIPRVVDTVGAGDGFDAGFMAGRLLGRDPWQSAELGNVVGAHALMVEGDYEGYPTMAEAEAFMAGRARVAR
jgi:2-dehydro-3-deoxygluconokinase